MTSAARAAARRGGRGSSVEPHPPEQGPKSGMVVEGGEQERALDAVDGSRPLGHRALEARHRPVRLAEAGVDVREVVRGYIAALRSQLELPQDLPRLIRPARQAV